jgi:hypothetical protein
MRDVMNVVGFTVVSSRRRVESSLVWYIAKYRLKIDWRDNTDAGRFRSCVNPGRWRKD